MSAVELSYQGPVAHLRLNRPEKRNALDAAMMAALREKCRELERSDAQVVILSSTGQVFCAGGDIDGWGDLSPEAFARFWVREGHETFDALARVLQPLILVMQGHALGGGLELAACADLRIAEQHIKIGQPETSLGIIPGWSGTQRAVRRFGAQPVRRMALMGEVLSADEAQALGIVDRVVASGAGLRAAEDLAQSLRRRSPQASIAAKMMINAAEGEERERVLESFAGQLAAGSTDLQHGLAAFRAKRPPDFSGD